MPLPFALPLALSGLSALGGIFSNRDQKSNQTQTANQTGTTSATGSTAPVYDDQNLEFRNSLIQAYMQQLGQDPDLTGYKTQGISDINRLSDIRKRVTGNNLTARGLTHSPIAGLAAANADNSRISDIAGFLSQIPILRDKLRMDRLNAAGTFQRGIPTGTSSTQQGTTQTQGTTTGNTVAQGNPLGGGIAGFTTTLAGLLGQKYGLQQTAPSVRTPSFNPDYDYDHNTGEIKRR